jgi:hypothetical protein
VTSCRGYQLSSQLSVFDEMANEMTVTVCGMLNCDSVFGFTEHVSLFDLDREFQNLPLPP